MTRVANPTAQEDGDASPGQARSLLLDAYAPEPNALERRALSFLDGPLPEGRVPIDPDQRGRLAAIQRRVVWTGIASGTLSGLLLGAGEIWLTLGLFGDEDRGILDDPVPWALFYVAVGLVTLAEILFLYWVTLRGVGEFKRIVGVPDDPAGLGDLVRAALARAALETPNPDSPILGIDPHAYKPRWLLLARNLAYKAKVGVTSFVLRIALRRLFVRAVLRSYVPLLAAPLYAAWNAWILHRIMEEARVRSFGPFAVRALLDLAREAGGDARMRAAIVAVIVELVRRSGDGHSNYVLLLHGLRRIYRLGEGDLASAADRGRAAVEELSRERFDALEEVLLLSAVLSGRPSRRQAAFLVEAHGWMGRAVPAERLGILRRRLREGEDLRESGRSRHSAKEAASSMQLETAERLPTP